ADFAGRHLPLARPEEGLHLPALRVPRQGRRRRERAARQGNRRRAVAHARGDSPAARRAPLAAGAEVRRRFPRRPQLPARRVLAGILVKVVVGMSGGVDSSVAALLARRAGHEVVGLFMKNWEDDDDDEYCSTREDLIDAAAAADRIGIDLEAVN